MKKRKQLRLTIISKKHLVILLLSLGLLAFGYILKDYLPCITKSFSSCVNSKEYISNNGKFSFRYPKDYQPIFKTGEDLVKQYGWWKYNPGSEWIQFREKFIPTRSLEDQSDNFADVIVEKATDYKNLEDYKKMVLDTYSFNKQITSNIAAPQISQVKVAGQDALHVIFKQTHTSFPVPNDGYIFFYSGDMYLLDFHDRKPSDKALIKDYENAKQVIVSSFRINKQAYELQATNDSENIPTPAYENREAMIKELPEVLPNGWRREADTHFRKSLNGITYTADFQLNNQEYLREGGAYAFDLSLLESVTTKKGTIIYITKENSGYIYASACNPSRNAACSIPFGNQLLFIMLHVYRPNDQYPRELDFNAPGLDTIIKEFSQIIESSNL